MATHIRMDGCPYQIVFEEIGALVAVGKDPQPPQDIPRGMEIAKKFGLEFLPPPGARAPG